MVKAKISNSIPVSQRTHSVTFTKVNGLTPFENIILIWRIIHETHTYTYTRTHAHTYIYAGWVKCSVD